MRFFYHSQSSFLGYAKRIMHVGPLAAPRAPPALTLPPAIMKSPSLEEEREYLRNYFMEPYPRVIQSDGDDIRSYSGMSTKTPAGSTISTTSTGTPTKTTSSKTPPAPKKRPLERSFHLRKARADDIVETAQHLMDLCMANQTAMENMEKTFDDLLFGTQEESEELDNFTKANAF